MLQLNECPVCSSPLFDSYITTAAQMHPGKERFNFDQCSACQLVFLNPRVPLELLKNYYTSYYLPYRGSKAWGKFEALVEKSQFKLDLKRVKRVTDWQKMNTNALLLDIGCGKPTFLQACKEELNCRTVGIDFSDEGWSDETNGYQDLELRVAEIQDLSAELQPDVITMWHYLEHDYTPLANLKHLKTIAKPSTKLIIEIPNFDSTSRKKFGADWAGWHTPRHTSLFSPNNVALLLNNSGWKVDQILTYGTMDPYLLFWMSRMEQKGIEWKKNMEEEFWSFVIDMVLFLPKKWREKKSSLGVMTVIASPQ
ncbi:MAG: 2-polyprenyl-3-methyl-5-hydroxy-6-metoxy-1,4-benzoquinol methylase [Cyclobacteriaceae bacterium]|jgi:2-polyprenyl-3-methyl-5-hydroxy-6-metoxy-1,4-benzoquinol methylase